ncbi:MAG: hypothetical protein QGI12_05785 [Acidimicrobiales bacterium]|jgi:hypothetical protein|nr:hypothetical protein [Acidimicrobiales bacterium]
MMDSDNPIDDLKKFVPFEQGPDDSQEESELRASLLESIFSADMNRSLRERIRRSLAGVPLWRRPRLVVPSFAVMTIMSVLIISTTTSPSALAEVSEATENSVNANSGVSTTLFEIVDSETKEVKYSEETVFIYEEDNYSFVHPDFEIRRVDGLEYIYRDGQWVENETLRNTGIWSIPKNSEKFKDFSKDGRDFKRISSKRAPGQFRGKIPASKIFDIRETNTNSQIVELVKKSVTEKSHQASADFTVTEGLLTEMLIEASIEFPGREPHLVRIRKTFTEHDKSQNIYAPEVENVTQQRDVEPLCQKKLDQCGYSEEIKILEELEERRPGLCEKSPRKALSRLEMMSWIEKHSECLMDAGEKTAADAFMRIVITRTRFGL